MRAVELIVGLGAALSLTPGMTAEAVRCASKVISRGDHAVEVLHHCGEPDVVRTWVTRRGVIGPGTILLPGFFEDVLVEEWTYNLGPHKLMRQIRLENGVVRDVDHLGYGFLPRRPQN